MKSTNPIFNEEAFEKTRDSMQVSGGIMTLQGTINKSLALIFITMIGFMISWASVYTVANLLWPASIAALIVGFIVIFKKNTAPFLAPVYAFLQGIVMGAISFMFEAQFAGIVLNAVGITVVVFFTMLLLYKLRIIKVTHTFRSVIIGATLAVCVFYLIALVMNLFGSPLNFMYSSSPLSIGISVIICGVAALNLMLDFDFIEHATMSGAMPKYMEWYAGFGLLVTLIWLYLEILKLLGKLNRR
ncbi:putative YccA/Bax inhibitor family protein [Elusimicrobium simillimum]|uniref:Bax inhibitor-1/YccA family protein n=1 Tax=Elusimicrobium simillimum TaxID=3143438 RepID=UPI003C6F2E0C